MKKVICMFLSVVLCITMLLSGSVVFGASTEYIKTEKTEYKSGEIFKVEYDFGAEESNRFICVYRGEAIYNNLMFAFSASAASSDGVLVPSNKVVWTWHGGGPSIMTSPLSTGTYIVKAMYLKVGGVTTSAPDYEEGAKSSLTATFTVVENTGSADPVISAAKTELEAGEDLAIAFDGVTNKLSTDTLQIDLKDGAGSLVKTWILSDGSTEYAGINGTVSYTDDLAAGTYTATLVCSNAEVVLGNKEIQFTVKAAPSTPTPVPTSTPASTPTNAPTNTPTGDAPVLLIAVLFMVAIVAYFMVKKRCTR